MNIRYIVELSNTEREELQQFVSGGVEQVRKVKRAQILLASDRGVSDEEIKATLDSSTSRVWALGGQNLGSARPAGH